MIVVAKATCTKAKQAIDPSLLSYYEGVPGAFDSAGVFIGCRHGKAHYYPTFTLLGTQKSYPNLKVKPGDKVTIKFSMISSATKLAVLDKTTRKASMTATGSGEGYMYGLTVGDEGWPLTASTPSGYEAVPKFGKIPYSGTVVAGQPLGSSSPFQYDKYNATGTTLQISTSSIASDNASFKTVFHHS